MNKVLAIGLSLLMATTFVLPVAAVPPGAYVTNDKFVVRLDNKPGPSNWESVAADGIYGLVRYENQARGFKATVAGIGLYPNTQYQLVLSGPRGQSAFLVLSVVTTNEEGNFGTTLDIKLRPGEYSGARLAIVQNSPPWVTALVETEPLNFRVR